MDTEKRITYSDPAEAVQKARAIFAKFPGVEWIIAEGAGTVGGVYYDGLRGDLVLHRAEKGDWTYNRTVGETKAAILESYKGETK